ncbi:MAG TPA: cytidylate kinase-like family protein [Gemmatimonadaceae bacterium]|jgi:cytidylate kinase|nr:cytidylate kinase-like family protein [Gemmatimonadaceae bacterium]
MALVTISRMFGSGGSLVAQRVAEALGWDLLDNQVVDAVAKRLGVTAAEVSAHEERVPSLVERLASAMTLSVPEMLPVADTSLPPTEERIVEVTEAVIEEAVQTGNMVLVGRGAQCLLANRPDALHVFCYAPRPALAAFVMSDQGVSHDEALRIVDATNRQREQYVKQHWNREWRAEENYDLCVNTGTLGIEGAARIVIDLARDRFE